MGPVHLNSAKLHVPKFIKRLHACQHAVGALLRLMLHEARRRGGSSAHGTLFSGDFGSRTAFNFI